MEEDLNISRRDAAMGTEEIARKKMRVRYDCGSGGGNARVLEGFRWSTPQYIRGRWLHVQWYCTSINGSNGRNLTARTKSDFI
jgi:hypothetical protein